MRIFFLILCCCVSVAAQTPDDLRKKYGAPVSESYEVRPNVLLTVEYGKEKQVCRMSLEPQDTGAKLPEPTLELLTNIVGELVPENTRGKNIINGFISSPGAGGSYMDYEKLVIFRSNLSDKKATMVVTRKDKGCGYVEPGTEWKLDPPSPAQ